MNKLNLHDTIAACATPLGYGGVGIIRVSGSLTKKVMEQLLNKELIHKKAEYLPFYDEKGEILDRGIVLYFKRPNSFTGEDILELQGHGGPIIMDCLLQEVLKIDGIRMAYPGEFTQRAFLNDKIDLIQAESVNNLIHASSESAARAAIRSLEGDFSSFINNIVSKITNLRMFVESSLDFAEEEIDFMESDMIDEKINEIEQSLEEIIKSANQGSILSYGLKTVIIGKPNAGKSSLLNALARKNLSIVTDIPGTTRDTVKTNIQLGRICLEIVDTAGIRETKDIIEKEGVKRAREEIKNADIILVVLDKSKEETDNPFKIFKEELSGFSDNVSIFVLNNKIDITDGIEVAQASVIEKNNYTLINISAKEKIGLTLFEETLMKKLNLNTENNFSAKKRHVNSLKSALIEIEEGKLLFKKNKALELLAYHLKLSQEKLSEIVGEFTTDDLLGKIFSEFCIGK